MIAEIGLRVAGIPGKVDEIIANPIIEAEEGLGGDPIARAPQLHAIVTREIHIPVTAMYHEVDVEGDVSVVHEDGHEAARRRGETHHDQACAVKAVHGATVGLKALLVVDLHETTRGSGENDQGPPHRMRIDEDHRDVAEGDNAMHPLEDLALHPRTVNRQSLSEGGILYPEVGQQNVEREPREVYLHQGHAARRDLGAIAADGMIARGSVEVQGVTKAAVHEVIHRTIQVEAGVEIDTKSAAVVIRNRSKGANRPVADHGTVLQLPLTRELVEN